ncbi:MAG: methionyl-tRNA formyltransferase [Prolixibacteraceae bacterium]|nr:methionyl-tRNA formyltransferase [Prolixibacteraceae bacterium]
MGTPGFAVASLKALVEGGYKVVGVVTAPDKPSGRGQKISESPVKQYAVQKGLKVLQPEKLKDTAFLSNLEALGADLQVVVAFRMLPELVWAMPRLGTFNLHASLLPRYRGAAPINWAIINGDTETGVTTFLLQHEIDTGSIIFQEKTEIGPDENVEAVHDKLMEIGARLVIKTVDALAPGNVKMISQEELIKKGINPSHAPKIFKEDCLINWKTDVTRIKNFIRGLSPYPAAWTNLYSHDGKTGSAKIFRATAETVAYQITPGSIYSDGKAFLKIGCINGWINVKEIQLAGKKRMDIDEFLRGVPRINDWRCLSE